MSNSLVIWERVPSTDYLFLTASAVRGPSSSHSRMWRWRRSAQRWSTSFTTCAFPNRTYSVTCCGVCGTDGHIHDGEFIAQFPVRFSAIWSCCAPFNSVSFLPIWLAYSGTWSHRKGRKSWKEGQAWGFQYWRPCRCRRRNHSECTPVLSVRVEEFHHSAFDADNCSSATPVSFVVVVNPSSAKTSTREALLNQEVLQNILSTTRKNAIKSTIWPMKNLPYLSPPHAPFMDSISSIPQLVLRFSSWAPVQPVLSSPNSWS